MKVKIIYKSKDVPRLKKATAMSAGYDVIAYLPDLKEGEKVTIQPNCDLMVDTGVSIFINDPNYAMQLLPRSGLGVKNGVILKNTIGLIDADYQNSIKACLVNNGNVPFELKHGDRIAQLIFIPIIRPTFEEVESFNETTERGLGGFGSTGK